MELIFYINSFIFTSYWYLKQTYILDSSSLKVEPVFCCNTWLFKLALTSMTYSVVYLIYSAIVGNFHIKSIHQISHTSQENFYKFFGIWGSHDSSLLIWLWFVLIFAYVFKLSFQPVTTNSLVRNELSLTIAFYNKGLKTLVSCALFFYGYILFTANPFLRLSNFQTNGTALNPILQDPILAIHPLFLYIGYIGLSVLFACSYALIQSLLVCYITKSPSLLCSLITCYKVLIRKFLLISWFFLTLGIALGSYWAYTVLGWGSYWFWDAVENISLLPWILCTILIHDKFLLYSTTYQLKRLTYNRTFTTLNFTLLVTAITYFISLFSNFIVKSGLLTSVHAFATVGNTSLCLLVFLLGYLFAYGSLYYCYLNSVFFAFPNFIRVHNITKKTTKTILSYYWPIYNIFMISYWSLIVYTIDKIIKIRHRQRH